MEQANSLETGKNIAPITVFENATSNVTRENPYSTLEVQPDMLDSMEQCLLKKCDNITNLDDQWARFFIRTTTDDEFANCRAQLTPEQSSIVELFEEHYSNIELGNKPEPIRIFVTGPGGTGKSWLIRYLRELLLRRTNKNSVLLTAFTGIAARVIRGLTLHSALRLPVRHKYLANTALKDGSYMPLQGAYLDEIRLLFCDIDTLAIDEVSMVSHQIFENVHLTLTTPGLVSHVTVTPVCTALTRQPRHRHAS